MKPLTILSALTVSLILLTGCGGESGSSNNQADRDYAAEAEATITAENMDSHLEALEAEIAADEATVQD